jgi:serine/threonine protein kinase
MAVSLVSSIGFGVVWKGRYKGDPVAIKTIQESSLTPESIAGLKTEANIMRRLAHPRIVACFGVFENKGNHCMLMELMEGGSLQGYIKDKPCPEGWNMRFNIAIDICQGLGYLHKLNVIHRDLKPGNVVMDRFGRGKITDFGLSVIKNTAATSIKGFEMGTVQYMVLSLLTTGS